MKSVATIKIKIPYNSLLADTMKTYSKCINYISDIGFKNKVINRYKLHHLVYYKAKDKFNLPSQFIINAIRIASQTLKSVKTNKGNKPIFKDIMPLDFDKRTFNFSFEKVRITTINGRKDIPIEVPEYYWKYLDWNYQTMRITIDKFNRMFLHISFARDINTDISCSNGKTVGVDVGINHIAVTSDKKFFRGNKVKQYRIKFKNLRSKLQSKGTRSSRKLLKKISGRENRFKTWINHNISRQIISDCGAGDTIVLENIKNIRKGSRGKRFNFWLNGWSFYQLQNFITYKAVINGIKIIKVNPCHTSQRCSKCGNLGIRSKGFFKCVHCEYSLNSDLNASFNLAKHSSICESVSVPVTEPYIPNDDSKAIFCGNADEFRDNFPESPTL
ncbi:MAG: transposase [Nanoarchaeota archaeon]|nr:transposase [Nanoarchaeota archaeon]